MAAQSEFFIERANVERSLAEASPLHNVRENHLRSAAAWDRLAARAVKSDELRVEEQKRKAALVTD